MKIISNNLSKALKKTLRNTMNKVSEVSEIAKEKYSEVKTKAEPIIIDAYTDIKNSFIRTKLEKLDSEFKSLKNDYSKEFLKYELLKKTEPKNSFLLYKHQKDIELLKQKITKTTEEYNSFAAKQKAAQAAFDRLNNF